MRKLIEEDWVGRRFSRLEVLALLKDPKKRTTAACLCDCGNIKEVLIGSLVGGNTKSCGCFCSEYMREKRLIHGATLKTSTKELRKTYAAWSCMKNRCRNIENSRYPTYGNRGITVDASWEFFEKFLADMGVCPAGFSLERKDNDKGYCKSNCIWIPHAKQAENRTDTIRISYLGKEWCLKNLCKHLELKYLKIYKRYILRHWTLAESLEIRHSSPDELFRIGAK